MATYFAEGWVVAVDSNVSKSALMISFFIDFTMFGASVGLLRHIRSKDIGAHICLHHSALLYNAHIVYINNCQGGKDSTADFVICVTEQFCQKGKHANENTSR